MVDRRFKATGAGAKSELPRSSIPGTIFVTRGEIWLAALDPTIGSEIRKTRPCLIISPWEIHNCLRTVMVAPMTTGNRLAPFRIPVSFAGKDGLILLDQIRVLDKQRLVRRLGVVERKTLSATLLRSQEIFQE